MKRLIISAAILSAVFMSAGAFAAGTETGQLTITGKVTEHHAHSKRVGNL